jgi:hypothetical protein
MKSSGETAKPKRRRREGGFLDMVLRKRYLMRVPGRERH